MTQPITIHMDRVTAAEMRSAQSVLLHQNQQTEAEHKKKMRNGWFGWALFVSTAILLFMYLQQRPTASPAAQAPPPPADTGFWSTPTIMVVAGYGVLLVAWFVLIRLARAQAVNRPVTYYFDESGIVVETPTQRNEWRWTAFHNVAELNDVWVLRFSPASGLVVPKRGIEGGPERLLALQQLIQSRSAAQALPVYTGFEVQQ